MKSLLLVAFGCGMVISGVGASELTDRIRGEAQACADALITGDYAGVIARTHPRIVTEMGGPQAAASLIADSVAEMKAEGIVLERATIAAPSEPVANGAVVAVLVQQTIILRMPKGHFRQIGHLLAVSEDGGANWKFIDTGNLTEAALAQYFPQLATLVKLPPKTEPERIGD